MNQAEANTGVEAKITRRTTRKRMPSATNGTQNENETNKEKVTAKGLKRSISENPVVTRKRTAFGDITNAIQSHKNRIALGKKEPEKKCPVKKEAKVALPKRTSNRLKGSKSSSSLPTICTENSTTFKNKKVKQCDDILQSQCEDILQFQCEDILQSRTSTSTEESDEKVPQIESILPDGVAPFDLEEEPDHVCEYAHSIFENMRIREARFPVADYLSCEGRLTTGMMRAILVDWLVEVQQTLQLYHETLYVAVKLVDNYLQVNDAPKEELQLVGATALQIACKIEEYHPPSLDDFQYLCNDAYTKCKFLEMEIRIFKTLDFDINIPISYRYLRRFSRVTSMGGEILTLARFILELSLHKAIFVHQPSSKMAATSLCLAMKMSKTGEWNVNHCYHSGYQEKELMGVMKQLNQMLIESHDSKLKTVQTKYSHPIHFSVAKTKPLSVSFFSSY